MPRYAILIIILLAVFFSTVSKSLAEENSDIDKKKQIEVKIEKKTQILNKLKKKLQYEQYRLNVINYREQDLAEQLAGTGYKLRSTQDKLEHTKILLERNQRQLEITKEKLLSAKSSFDLHKRQLTGHLRAIYENNDINYLAIILKSVTFSDFLNRMEFLRLIINEDVSIINKFKKRENLYNIQRIKYQERILENIKLKQELKAQEELLLSLKNKRQYLLNEVVEQRKSLSKYIIELEHSSKELESQIEALIKLKQSLNIKRHITSPYGASEYFIWPTASRYITSNFGWRSHPVYGRVKFHTGIDIAAKYGSPIMAAASGVVIHSGWLGGYGSTVIIDHGGDYSTIYAHCSRLYVSEGQKIAQGERIALIGSTGLSTGPHLHFEVRYKGKPINPYSKLK